MLQAYIDASGKGSKDVLTLAGYIATAEQWTKFTEEWGRLVEMRSPHYRRLDYFKMQEMTSDLDRERCHWFYRIIEDNVAAAVSCSISVIDLEKAVREFPWPSWVVKVEEVMSNPYYFGFKAILDKLAQHQRMLKITEPIGFIFDNEGEKTRCLEGWEDIKRYSDPEVGAMMGDAPLYRDDRTTLPLQAADLYAYWVRRWELEGIEDGIEKLKFPWPVRRVDDFPRIDFRFKEDDFIVEFNKIWDLEVQRRIGLNSGVLGTAVTGVPWTDSSWTGNRKK